MGALEAIAIIASALGLVVGLGSVVVALVADSRIKGYEAAARFDSRGTGESK